MSKILFLEPFYGGSHKDFADGLMEYSKHDIDLHTLPARFWKWRMRGAALYFYKLIPDPEKYSGLVITDLMSLSDLKALWGARCPKSLVYFHENQLSYPLPEGEKMDYQFGFTDITTSLVADSIVFNSEFHKNAYIEELPKFIRKMPEKKPLWAVDEIKAKTSVIYPGCRYHLELDDELEKLKNRNKTDKPLLIWNHRWEFDKNPEAFFTLTDRLLEAGCDFNLALLGENFQMVPKPFIAAKERYGERILQYGYTDSRRDYYKWLAKGDLVISTSNQENFGISIMEAVRMGCYPLLPRRLSYPELVPKHLHSQVIYESDDGLFQKAKALLAPRDGIFPIHDIDKKPFINYALEYSWEKLIPQYDSALDTLIV